MVFARAVGFFTGANPSDLRGVGLMEAARTWRELTHPQATRYSRPPVAERLWRQPRIVKGKGPRRLPAELRPSILHERGQSV
jgi:hypothetical protein